jgi:hypothetical protein
VRLTGAGRWTLGHRWKALYSMGECASDLVDVSSGARCLISGVLRIVLSLMSLLSRTASVKRTTRKFRVVAQPAGGVAALSLRPRLESG